ncbi:MAG: PEP-CTERM sorting domain-containing protein [Roseiarcus sp.]|uniref:PEP-CTERM sorting domain-containing protein n=1 Tax=Roseiarcus sp. TaxID=1969460 RepID=UPI003C576C79
MRGFHFVLLLALSGLAFVGLGASARALTVEPSGDIVIVTFTGTVNYSTDPNGIFGCGVTDSCDSANPYGGDTFTAVFTFNTGVGVTVDVPGTLVSVQGGSSVAAPSPLVDDATATVNGVTYNLPGDYYAFLETRSAGGFTNALPYNLFAYVADANGNNISGSVFTTTDPPQFPVSITTPFSANFVDDGLTSISFDCTSGEGTCLGSIDADLTVSLVNESTVPEPSTWIMMAVGFAALGFAGYRKARVAAVA